jgi:hypothetical protein
MIATARDVDARDTYAKDAYACGHEATHDRQLHAAAMAELSNSKYGALRHLSCRVFEGVVEISGTVSSFYLKQLAQAAVLKLYPSAVVRNLVEVSGETPVLVASTCEPVKKPA